MDNYSLVDSSQQLSSKSSSYNFNVKTIFLFIILISACCLLSIGYNFDINNLSTHGISMVACVILVLFFFYIMYEFFKSDTCEDLKKTGTERMISAFGRGRNYIGQQGTEGMQSFGNALNAVRSRATQQPYASQPYAQQPYASQPYASQQQYLNQHMV